MKDKYLKRTEKFINEKALKCSSSYILKKNNLLLSIYATIGVPMINLIDVAIPQSILGFILNKENNLDFIYYLFVKSKKQFIAISETGSQPNISLRNIEKLSFIIPKLDEQQKIAKFFSLLDKQIELWNIKLQLSEQLFIGYKQKIYNKILKFKDIKFNDLFTEYYLKNKENLFQYTIGKNGIKKIKNINYDISDHKIFIPNSLVVGIGIEEIVFNKDIKGCCSPIYKTYELNNEFIYLKDFLHFFIKFYLNMKANKISKKSTRREWEIENKALRYLDLKIPINHNIINKIYLIENFIYNTSIYISFLKQRNNFYMENIFVK